MRKIVILAEAAFEWHSAKTATGVIRYGKDTVVAVIDSTRAGQDVAQALNASFGQGIPVVRDIHEALTYQPDTLLIGIAPRGGALPEAWRAQLLVAIAAGLNLISGLHAFLSDDKELADAAADRGVTIWDVRRPPDKKLVSAFTPHREGSHTILMVGSDCGSGKMTAALELDNALRQQGKHSAFVATGQTGIMISGTGLPVDHLIVDFVAGLVEDMVLDFSNRYDWVFVEGQGALNHPGYSPVTLGLLHGSRPDALIFCHRAGATTIEGYEQCPLPSLNRLIEMNQDSLTWLHPERTCKVVGLALVTHHLAEQQAREAIQLAQNETGLPVTDVVRFGPAILLDALNAHFG